MNHGTCLFCDHAFIAKSKARKFCHDCLPEHASDPKEYARRYPFLAAACLGKNEENARRSIAHLHEMAPTSLMPPKVWHGPKAPKACAQCGDPHWGRKFCSKICSRRAYEATPSAKAKKALRRRREYEQVRNDPTKRDRMRMKSRLSREKMKAANPRSSWELDCSCVDCGCPIPPRRKRCAEHAWAFKSIWLAEYRRSRPNVRAANQRYRARKRTATVERFGDTEIFERDGWLCQLCGTPINRKAKFPHPESVSLDHVIPLSRGGDHSRANTQCAHYGCNSRKNNRYDGFQQLALEVA